MLNELLITEDDFKLYRPLPVQSFRFEDLTPHILEAQRGWVRKSLLGEALYHDLEQNRTLAKYVNLLNGTTYTYNGDTIKFYGLVPALSYYAWSLFMRGNNLKITRSGNKQKNSANSENADAELQAQEYNKAMNNASMYAREVQRYLGNNTATYTLYEQPTTRPESAISVTAVTRSRVVLDERDDTLGYYLKDQQYYNG